MSKTSLIALAEACSGVRISIGRMLLTVEESADSAKASEGYRRALKRLLRIARESECGLYLEVAGELATQDP